MNDNRAYLYIDESQEAVQCCGNSNLYLCVSLILSEDFDEICTILKEKEIDIKSDQFMGIKKKSINKILHYNDANEGVKNAIVDTLRMLFFKSYISTVKLKNKAYDEAYYIILKSLIKDRIIKHKDRTTIIRYEQNSKISSKGMAIAVDDVMASIKKENKYIIKANPILEEVTKNDCLVSIPDYTLGLFIAYLQEKEKPAPLAYKINRFEKIRSKIRLFIDLNIPKYYSRKHFRHI